MPGLVPGIHVLLWSRTEDVDGRVKPGHDDVEWIMAVSLAFCDKIYNMTYMTSLDVT
jgi:hypothetical protein